MMKALPLQRLKRLDWIMVVVMVILLSVGIAFVFSADYRNPTARQLFQKQVIWMGIGLICFFGMALTDYHQWIRMAWGLYGVGLILLILVFVPHIGLKICGANRWIQIAGPWILQPAELMKLAVVLILARLFGWPGRNIKRRRFVLLGLALVLVPFVLIVRQPDLGTALILLPVLGVMMFVAGVPGRVVGILLALAMVMTTMIVGLIVIPTKLGWSQQRQEQLIKLIGLTRYQRDRIMVYLNYDRDPLGAGWNKAQSQIAVGSGRFWGKGYLQGTQNILGFLPRRAAPNDFIFSVIAEERGFVGSVVVLGLFAMMVHLGLRAASVASDKMGSLLCVGVVAVLFCHIFINIAMTIGVLPITGIPLPLISYGGTFMVGTMMALGMVQSVYIRGDWR